MPGFPAFQLRDGAGGGEFDAAMGDDDGGGATRPPPPPPPPPPRPRVPAEAPAPPSAESTKPPVRCQETPSVDHFAKAHLEACLKRLHGSGGGGGGAAAAAGDNRGHVWYRHAGRRPADPPVAVPAATDAGWANVPVQPGFRAE